MSILNTILTLGKSFEVYEYVNEYGRGRMGPNLTIRAHVRVPYSLFSEELWHQLDDDFTDPLTGSIYTTYDFDGDEETERAVMSINVKGVDIARAVALIRRDLDKVIASAPTSL